MNKSQDGQNKAKPMKDELNEQDLNKASGGVAQDVIGGNAPLPSVDGLNDTHGVQSPIVAPSNHSNPFHKG